MNGLPAFLLTSQIKIHKTILVLVKPLNIFGGLLNEHYEITFNINLDIILRFLPYGKVIF